MGNGFDVDMMDKILESLEQKGNVEEKKKVEKNGTIVTKKTKVKKSRGKASSTVGKGRSQ